MQKTCSLCKESKDIESFCKRSSSKDGHNYRCRECELNKQRIRKGNTPRWSPIEPAKEGFAFCSKCHIQKSLIEFHKSTTSKKGRNSQCRSCRSISAGHVLRRVYEIEPDPGNRWCSVCKKQKSIELFPKVGRRCKECYSRATVREYGLTEEDYDQMLHKQNYRCAICGSNSSSESKKKGRFLYIDHDHYTGKVRGLLCSKCNSGIGLLGDDFEVLECAADYLRTHAGY